MTYELPPRLSAQAKRLRSGSPAVEACALGWDKRQFAKSHSDRCPLEVETIFHKGSLQLMRALNKVQHPILDRYSGKAPTLELLVPLPGLLNCYRSPFITRGRCLTKVLDERGLLVNSEDPTRKCVRMNQCTTICTKSAFLGPFC